MISIPGFVVSEVVCEGQHAVVARAKRGERSVLIRTTAASYPTPADLARLRYGAEIERGLALDGVMKVDGIETYGGRLAVLLDDFGGRSLRSVLRSRRLSPTEAVNIALRIVKTLGELHQRSIVHKSLEPSSIFINEATGQVKITNFDIASRLSQEIPAATSVNWLDGSVAYISPEQTGRMNRTVDYRSDLYSLGVTLYEALTGEVPFPGADLLTVVYGHIAVEPAPPHVREPQVPPALSSVVMKLLAKNAEDRYQSAYGLAEDLKECLARLAGAGGSEPFVPGARDTSASFRLPQKLYGREAERARLIEAFVRTSDGPAELMLVSGYSGIGKSALVNELQRPVVERRGAFASGKFDELRTVPYAAFIQALGELVRQLLTESEERLARWRERIIDAVGANTQIIVDVVPELAAMIGPQPPVPRVGITESQNRFNVAFRGFIGALARPDQPLALFLDDLQWADSGSLTLLELLLNDPGSRHLLVVGSYRDNEVHGAHPLMLALERIRSGPAAVRDLTLAPLARGHIEQLVSDAFGRSSPELAEIVQAKTGGNPFFVSQFLDWLHARGHLSFDASAGQWRWDLRSIREVAITDNVASLMAEKLERLSADTQRVLRLAACIGSSFDIKTLALVAEQGARRTGADLWPAVEEGLILPTDEAYKYLDPDQPTMVDGPSAAYSFLHDRVREAAYALISAEARQEVHLRVGRLLLKNLESAQRKEGIFDVVDHLNRCLELITEAEERLTLAQLNLEAAARATSSSAYELALGYATTGLGLLPEGPWDGAYDLALALTKQRGECEYVLGRLAEAEATATQALERARSRADKAEIYWLQHRINVSRGKPTAELLRWIRSALALYGVEMPDEDAACKAAGAAEIGRVQALLASSSIEALAHLPVLQDQEDRARARLLSRSIIHVYVDLDVFALLTATLVRHSVERGNSAGSAMAYAAYAMIVGGGFDDWASAYELGRVALSVSDAFDDLSERSIIQFYFAVFINPWRQHVRSSLPYLQQAYAGCMQSGALTYVGFAAVQTALLGYLRGEELGAVRKRAWEFAELQVRLKQREYRYIVAITLRACHLLIDGSIPEDAGDWRDEALLVERLGWVAATQVIHYVVALGVAFVLDDLARAAELAARAREGIASNLGHIIVVDFYFFDALLAASLPAGELPEGEEGRRRRIEENLAKVRGWAGSCPDNFDHKRLLLEAELARVTGQGDEAATLYDEAIEAAASSGFTQGQALACELAARFHLARRRRKIAQMYLVDARHAYVLWGAHAKVAQLHARYRDVLPRGEAAGLPGPFGAGTAALDLTTVMKASQAISSEIVLGDLLKQLMSTLLENAGAQRGFLLLRGDDQTVVEAERTAAQGHRIEVHPDAEGSLSDRLSMAVVRYVERTGETVVVGDTGSASQLQSDPYIARRRPKSLLCTPILRQKKLKGILYLENNLVTDAFTDERRRVLELLAGQAAISLENAKLYDTLDSRVKEQTKALLARNEELSWTLQRLKDTQQQLITQEKLASLGMLTSGIAHEMRNPLNFINNFADISADLADELRAGVERQRGRLDEEDVAELEDTIEMLRGNSIKIVEHARRADGIVSAMLAHSRTGGGERRDVDVSSILEEYVNLTYRGCCSRDPSFQATIEALYDPALPTVHAVPQDIGRVLLNLVNNAFYAASAKRKRLGPLFSPTIAVATRDAGDQVEIRIRDNGDGIAVQIRDRLFTPFFTTKPPGEGTGLGLSISYDIVVQGHGGALTFDSVEGEYAEFMVTLPKGRP
jgi:histidine kinase